jgi:hypothetical protein
MESETSKKITKNEKDSKREEQLLTDSEKLMPELRTLAYCQNRAVEKGFTDNFRAVSSGLECLSNKRVYQPEQLQIVDFYRFEGITDPADMSVLYVIKTNDGIKGTLVDAYGAYADVAKVIIQINGIVKKAAMENGLGAHPVRSADN